MKVGASELRSGQGKPETQRATGTENHHKPCPGRHHGLHPHYIHVTEHLPHSRHRARCCIRTFRQINQSWSLCPQNLYSHKGVRIISKQ